MKINYYDLQGTKFYLQQNNYFGRVYINTEHALLVAASGDFRTEIIKVLGSEDSRSESEATYYWPDVREADVTKVVDAVFNLGSTDDKAAGMPEKVTDILRKVSDTARQQVRKNLQLVG